MLHCISNVELPYYVTHAVDDSDNYGSENKNIPVAA
jgi:hypothetical protein